MGAKSAIGWTDASWSPLRARVRADAAAIAKAKGYTSLVQIADKMKGRVGHHCEHVSPGCLNCYSGTIQKRCLPVNGTGLPFDRRSRDLVDSIIDEKILMQPYSWRTPRKIFVESQSDLFGEWNTFEMIDEVFTAMVAADWHTYQILTKRIDRALEYFSSGRHDNGGGPDRANYHLEQKIWLGVSVEDQRRADERIPKLLLAPAEVRFISAEPLLEALDLMCLGDKNNAWINALDGKWRTIFKTETQVATIRIDDIPAPKLDWVIVGSESGRGARPFHEDWVRSIRDQCEESGVALFYKQNTIKGRKVEAPELDGRQWLEFPK